MNINFIKSITILTFVAGLFSCSPKIQEAPQPNILFIMSDDHAFQAISAYNDKLIQTPNIDKIAQQGIIYNKAL